MRDIVLTPGIEPGAKFNVKQARPHQTIRSAGRRISIVLNVDFEKIP
jgi:hypothetical protein